MGICLNKILEDEPELKKAEKGIKGEEAFFYACQLCSGYKPDCPQNPEYQRNLSVL